MPTLNVTARHSLPTARDDGPATTGVWVGVATISMSFAAYTSALVVRQGTGTDWLHFHLPLVLYANTAVIIASSAALERARHGQMSAATGDAPDVLHLPHRSARAVQWLGYAILLGLVFLAGQLLAWHQLADQGLFLATNPSSAFFYILTALHGLHLVGGLGALLYVRRRLGRGTSGAGSAFAAAALYWHFMAVLWIAILTLLVVRF